MRVFRGFDDLATFVRPVVTIGSYDGVHRGHKVLLNRIKNLAKEKGGESVVVTFHPHPRQIIDGGCGVRLLNSLDEKLELLAAQGIDNVIVVPFTEEFSRISSYDFVKEYLVGKVGVATLIVGYNHHFGHNREGNFDYLDKLRAEFGFDIYMLPRQEVDNDNVSSTAVRRCIGQGDMWRAQEFLGYPYFITGGVDAAGAFTMDEPCKLLPPDGQYAVEVACGGVVAESQITIEGQSIALSDSSRFGEADVRLTFI